MLGRARMSKHSGQARHGPRRPVCAASHAAAATGRTDVPKRETPQRFSRVQCNCFCSFGKLLTRPGSLAAAAAACAKPPGRLLLAARGGWLRTSGAWLPSRRSGMGRGGRRSRPRPPRRRRPRCSWPGVATVWRGSIRRGKEGAAPSPKKKTNRGLHPPTSDLPRLSLSLPSPPFTAAPAAS